MDAVVVNDLVKKFNTFAAVDGISFSVRQGELFGLLGPNGAGKSTTIYMLTTLIKSTSGNATVNGFDIRDHPDKVRESIGIVFQDPTVDTRLSAYDNLDIHGRMYGMDAKSRKEKIDEVLRLVELMDWKDKEVKTFSGGMRRRLEIARGLMHTPDILFLDEPTLGLDPQTRRHIWSYIEKLRERGITIMLTTHYLEEADYLCDRVAIIDHGKIKVLDTPRNLKSAIGGNIISVGSRDPQRLSDLFIRKKICDKTRISETIVSFETKDGAKLVPKAMEIALKEGIEIESMEVHMPSLEDVFIYYTGSSIRAEKGAGSDFAARRRMHGH
ncbi:ATP-binding cassette domain-containing protein [Candidatus Micrarchaeota archaeon]|nr:ATP-binding cassette domain-containing protein [Candidatus Micrarchaeota archaeon]